MWSIVESPFIKARVSPATKLRIREAAQRQLLTESIWLRRLIETALLGDAGDQIGVQSPSALEARHGNGRPRRHGGRLYVRLRLEDLLLIRERATARGMAPARYVSILIRAHLRELAPLPKDDYLALRQATTELGALGRNLNQLARAANQTDRATLPSRGDLLSVLKVCEALRDHTKGLIRANVNSWKSGHVETEH